MANPHNLISKLKSFVKERTDESCFNKPFSELSASERKNLDDILKDIFCKHKPEYRENMDILHYKTKATPVFYVNTSGMVFQMAIKETSKRSAVNGLLTVFDDFMFMDILSTDSLEWIPKEKKVGDEYVLDYTYFKERVWTEQIGNYVMRLLGNEKPNENYELHHTLHRRLNLIKYLVYLTEEEHDKEHKGNNHDYNSPEAFLEYLAIELSCNDISLFINNLNILADLFKYFKGIKTSLDLATTDITHMSLNEILNSIEELY